MYFTERFDLSPYGEEFKDSYFILKLLDRNQTVAYTRRMAKLSKESDKEKDDVDEVIDDSVKVLDFMYKTVVDCFVSGEVYDNGELRAAKQSDLDGLPPKIMREASAVIKGQVGKKD